VVAALDKLVPGAADFFQSQDNAQVMALIQKAMDEYGNISLPDLKNLVLQSIPPTELAKIRANPQYKAEQAAADAQLNEVINSGGLTLADQAALNNIRTKSARAEGANRNAIAEGMASRGTLDSGAQLASELAGAQAGESNQAQADATTAGQAQMRALQAISQRGQNATNNLNTDWQEQAAIAAAQDAINRGNTSIANTASEYNAQLPQKNFENQLQLAGAKSGADILGAGAAGAMAKDQSQQNINSDVANGVKSYATFAGAPQAASSVTSGTDSGNPLSGSTQQAETSPSTKDMGGGGVDAGPSGGTAADSEYIPAGFDISGTPIFHKRKKAGPNF
jgi:hypothetical protein